MNQTILRNTLEGFCLKSGHDFRPDLLKKPLEERKQYAREDISLFINDLIFLLSEIEVSAKLNYLEEEGLQVAFNDLNTPFILFQEKAGSWMPVICYRDKKGVNQVERILIQGPEILDFDTFDFKSLVKLANMSSGSLEPRFAMITGLTWHSMVSHFRQNDKEAKDFSPLARLFRLLRNEKKDIGYIYVYAVLIGLISLSLPIGVQSIINLISSGQFFNSVIVLISLVILGVLISGALQIMQMTLVEILQRRIFSKAAYELAFRIPRLKMEHLSRFYPPELMNRFFEVVNIQKGLPKLLIELTAAMLQIIFGLLLLSIYHPFFVIFTGFLVFLVLMIFRFTGKKGLETKLMESKYKYKVVQWFEELSRTLASFKLAGATNLPLEKTDFLLDKYLIYRKKHFKILILQYSNVLAFKTLVTAGILIIGTVLVVDRQITLGQFVASELVVIIVVGALEKLVLGIDVVYDLLTAVEKLGFVTDLPLEQSHGFITRLPNKEKGLEIDIRDLQFTYPGSKKPAISGLTMHIPAGSRFCISGYSDSGKETLARLLGGIYTEFSGTFIVNDVSFKDLDINHYRDLVSKNFDRSEIFDGTILENITMNKPMVKYEDVSAALENLKLMETINRQPHGILTQLTGTGNQLSSSVLEKIILARCLVVKPSFLIISYPIFMIERRDRLAIQKFILEGIPGTTIGFISNDPELQQACDQVYVLEGGKLLTSGPYDVVKPYLNEM